MAETSGMFTITITGNKTGGYKIGAIGPNLTTSHDDAVGYGVSDLEWHSFPSRTTLLTEVEENILSRLADGSAEEPEIQQFGKKLYQAIFGHPSIQRAFDEARGWARAKDCPLRLWLEIQPPELVTLPWETMYDGHDWLSTRAKVPLVRRLGTNIPLVRQLREEKNKDTRQTLAISGPLKILFVGASPDGLDPLPILEIDKIGEVLKTTLHESIQAGKIKLDILYNATLEELQQALDKREHRSDQGYHILLFAGHGNPNGIYLDDGQGDDVIEAGRVVGRGRGEANPEKPVSAETLAEALESQAIRLVFLMACNTSTDPNPTDELLEGVAQTLVEQARVPAVVAMQYTFGVENAGTLGGHFFNALAGFQTVDVALATARPALKDGEQVNRDVFNPVLYLQAKDAALFKPKKNWPAIILSVALVLALLAGGILWWFFQSADAEAKRQANIIRASQLAAHSQKIIEQSPQVSLLLAVEALSTTMKGGEASIPLTEQALYDALRQTGGYVLGGHQNGVKAVAISHDNKWIVTNDGDTVQVWRLNIPLASPIPLAGQNKAIKAVAISDDSKWLVTGSASGKVQLWDLTQPMEQPITLPGRGTAINAVAISPNSRWLIMGEADGKVQVWDLKDLAAPSKLLAEHKDSINIVVISPDNQWLVTGSMDGTARVWNLNDLTTPSHPLFGHTGAVDAVAISTDSRWLVTGSRGGDYQAHRWNLHDLAASAVSFTVDDGLINDILISPNNEWLITVNAWPSNLIRLWNLNDPSNQPLILEGQKRGISAVAVSPDSRWLVTGSYDNTIKLWDLAIPNSPPKTLLGHRGDILSLAVSEDNQWLVSGSTDGTARLWNLTTPQAAPLTRQFHSGAVNVMAISADDRYLVTGGFDKRAQLWDLEYPLVPPITLTVHNGEIHTVAISNDNKWLVTGSDDNTARLFNLANLTNDPIVLTGHTEPIRKVAFSPDGRWLVTGSLDNTAKLWDLQATQIASSSNPLSNHGADIFDVAISNNSKWLVTASRDGTAQLWDLMNLPTTPITLTGHQQEINKVAFSPDNNWLVTGSGDATARVWNLHTLAAPPIILNQHQKQIYALAVSPNSQWLVTGSADTTARLWNLGNLTTPSQVVFGRDRLVNILAIDTNNKRLLMVSSDAVAELWNLEDLTAPAITLADHDSEITEALFSHNGQWLVTADEKGVVKLWNLQLSSLIDLACQTAGRNLTRSEWSRFLGQQDYSLICPDLPIPSSVEEPEATAIVPAPPVSSTPQNPLVTPTPPVYTSTLTPATPELLTDGFLYRATNLYLLNAQNNRPAINNAAEKYGVRIIPAEVSDGEMYWKVIGVHHLLPEENYSRHSIYIELLDEQGHRPRNRIAWAGWTWQGRKPQERADPFPLDRPSSEAAGSVSIHFGQKVSVWINGWDRTAADKSDRVENLHTAHPDEPLPDGRRLNTLGHHSFFVVFQLTRKTAVTPVVTTEPSISTPAAPLLPPNLVSPPTAAPPLPPPPPGTD